MDSYEYLLKALELGEKTNNQKVVGYACTWLSWTCAELGFLEDAILYGERAQEISKNIPTDHYLFFKSLGGIGFASFYKGDTQRIMEAGNAILEYGQRYSNIRSTVLGHYVIGLSLFVHGDFPSAIEAFRKGVQTAQDPFYSQFPRLLLGMSYTRNNQLPEAKEALREVANYSADFGCEELGALANLMLGLISIAEGQMGKGLKIIEEGLRSAHENNRRVWHAMAQNALGQVYLQIVDKSAKVSFTTMAKNIGFVLKNIPSAEKKAKHHFNKALEIAKEIGAKGTLGQTYIDLGRLHNAKGRSDQARDCFIAAVENLEECHSEGYLKQAKEALASLDQ